MAVASNARWPVGVGSAEPDSMRNGDGGDAQAMGEHLVRDLPLPSSSSTSSPSIPIHLVSSLDQESVLIMLHVSAIFRIWRPALRRIRLKPRRHLHPSDDAIDAC
jgi:hypothetical protein